MSRAEDLGAYVKEYEVLDDMVVGVVFNEDMDNLHSPSFKFGKDKDWNCDCKAGVYQNKEPCRHVKGLVQAMSKEDMKKVILYGINPFTE